MTKISQQTEFGGLQNSIRHNREPIYEHQEYRELPELQTFCCIQMKDGELCLRRPDKVMRKPGGGFVVERQWERPGKEPWNTDFYPVDDQATGKTNF